MVPGGQKLSLSGERFYVEYLLGATGFEAESMAESIAYEQTVEFPGDLIPEGEIKNHIVGTVESVKKTGDKTSAARISYAVEVTGFEFTQFLNNLYGNISILPDIRIIDFELPDSLCAISKGPRFGAEGIKKIFNTDKPLLCTALKPLGMSADELAEQAYQFAAGGVDLIKDDHGICNQRFSPYEERVLKCSEAVLEANSRYGTKTLYLPNVSGPYNKINDWVRKAKEAGAGGLLIAPGLIGMDTMKTIAEDDSVGLPVMAHPAYAGVYAVSTGEGLSHEVLYGKLMRMAGADMTVFPNFGGRFSFSREECGKIADFCIEPFGHLKGILPTPGGGMTTDKLQAMLEVYGNNLVFLMGGGLHRYSDDLVKNVEHFKNLIDKSF